MEWSNPHATEFALALGLGLFGLLILARRLARSPDAKSAAFLVLRGLALAILVFILLDPIRTVETRIPGERPSAVYLIDSSRSMGLERPSTRLEKVTRDISRAESSIVPERMPRIDRFRFGQGLTAISPGETARPVDDQSKLRDALERLPSRFGETPPFGVFVFSDGRSTDSKGLEEVAKGYKRLGVPIHVLPVGDPSIAGDVSIRDLVVPRDAPKGSKIPVKLVIGSRGFEGRRVEVVIRPATGLNVRPLATLPLTLIEGDQMTELVIEADRARMPMVVEILPLPGESVAENNRVEFQIASKSNKIRVIYMEGSPDPEYAFIRNALIESPEIECEAMSVDSQNSYQPRLHRVDDPSKGYPTTREELLSYDVVICSDIARSAFTAQQIEWTVELVAKRGGGFAMIGGHTSFGSGGWDRTPWDGMIPIDMSGDGAGRASPYYNGTFQVVVPPEAENHPIWRIVDDPAKNRQILDRMPPFYGTNLTDRLKPAATVLGVSNPPLTGTAVIMTDPHLRRSPTNSPQTKSTTGTPIFSAQPFGRGRSFAMSTDSTVSWGTDFERTWGEGDNRYFRKFWRNVVTWLAENTSGSSRRLEVTTDKIIYRPGQPILINAKAYDEKLEPTDRYRVVARLLKSGSANPRASSTNIAESPLSLREETQDFSTSLTVPSAELIRRANGSAIQKATVEVVAMEGDRTIARSNLDVQLLDDSEEFRDPGPDPALLESLARSTGGTVLDGPEDLARLLESSTEAVDRVVTSRSPAWDSPWLLSAVFSLLAIEWCLRRWKGLA